MSTPALLVIHPPSPTRTLVLDAAARAGFLVHVCDSGGEGLAAFRQRTPDMLLASLDVTDMEGLTLVRSVRDEAPDLPTVLVTSRASVESAVAAIRLGVHDYLREPLDAEKMCALLTERYDDALRRRVRLFPAERSPGVSFHGMIGRSVPMQRLFRTLRTVAPHVRTALVSGETGTGKELVARALHQLGPRAERRFVVINCSAVVETLFESELFGHMRGAFTGATDAKPGLFELADGGTLFLDEVREMDPQLQAKLLTLLDTQQFRRVGAVKSIGADVRFVAATNRILLSEVAAGRFRDDLYWRLQVIPVNIPPLRARGDDILLLAESFLAHHGARYGRVIKGLEPAVAQAFRRYSWPGNVRELENLIERIALLETDDRVLMRHLPDRLVREVDGRAPPPAASMGEGAEHLPLHLGFHAGTESFQRALIAAAVKEAGNRHGRAAQRLKLSRHALRHQMLKLGMNPSD